MNTYEYSCSHCNYFIETNGPWPYYGKDRGNVCNKDQFGIIRGPIHGLFAQVYWGAWKTSWWI
ncbi:MAG: hypothetical protein BWX92_01839 [Deltaproteobacteria bacterium ADurb.Bin135]|nr:MAG: hypothetical protein BWX92_01839 [Deltaproteobacteria bacterium ADurb.Bin135]